MDTSTRGMATPDTSGMVTRDMATWDTATQEPAMLHPAMLHPRTLPRRGMAFSNPATAINQCRTASMVWLAAHSGQLPLRDSCSASHWDSARPA
jgi:hypothetical protein